MSKKQFRMRPDSCDNSLSLPGVFLYTINLPSLFRAKKPFSCLLLCSPLLLSHASLSFTWQSYSSFSKAHQLQRFSPV